MSVDAINSVAGSYAVQGSPAVAPAQAPVPSVAPVDGSESAPREEFRVEEGTKNTPQDKEKDKEKEKASGQASKEALRDAVDKINKSVSNTSAIFGIHEKTNRITIKIVDKETHDVVKEIPAEETLDLVAKAWEMAGILVDEKR